MSDLICDVCPKHCNLKQGATGACRARINDGGKIVPQNYGKITSLALDPIEKKPLAEFFSGSKILSVGSYGCNLHCPWCQNNSISQAGDKDVSYRFIPPEELTDLALKLKPEGNIGVAYTYNEPLVSYEYVPDCATLVREAGMQNVLVTAGCVTREISKQVLPLIDAANIDLKSFSEDTYKNTIGGDLDTVKTFIEDALSYGCHVELTTLVVPGVNDSEDEIRSICEYIASLSPDIPLHITRFFPRCKMSDKAPTDLSVMYRFKEIANECLSSVYLGNC